MAKGQQAQVAGQVVREAGMGRGIQGLVTNRKESGLSSKCFEKPLKDFLSAGETGDSWLLWAKRNKDRWEQKSVDHGKRQAQCCRQEVMVAQRDKF